MPLRSVNIKLGFGFPNGARDEEGLSLILRTTNSQPMPLASFKPFGMLLIQVNKLRFCAICPLVDMGFDTEQLGSYKGSVRNR